MTGLNHVDAEGGPLTLTLSPTVTLTKISVGEMDNNAYLLQPTEGAAVLVDAAADAPRLLDLLGAAPVATIVTTHRHGDHWQALAEVADRKGPDLVAGEPDVQAVSQGAGVTDVAGAWDGDTVALGAETLEVIGLVGHTPGSITLAYTGGEVTHLLTGDSLFPGGPGRTQSPADFTRLLDDLEAKIFGRFADDTVVHPGHGDDTTLGAERGQLATWRSRGW